MTPEQRSAALRLADALPGGQLYIRPWAEEAAALLRELASEPQGELAVMHYRCNYLVACGKVCNKCGHTHCNQPQQTAEPQRKPLTSYEIAQIADGEPFVSWNRERVELFVREVERKLSIGEAP